MNAPHVVTVRPGVTFTGPAADSFRRAEAGWIALGHDAIDVNSTYRDWDLQLRMYNDWRAYVAGTGAKPNHSRAVHPRDSRHTSGLALDSDDWRRPGFIAHMAEHGWIRTAAHDPTEQHHFEYQSNRDKHHGEPVPAGNEDEMSAKAEQQINSIFNAVFRGGNSMADGEKSISQSLAEIHSKVGPIIRAGGPVSLRQEIADTKTKVYALEAALTALATAQGADPATLTAIVDKAVRDAMRGVTVTVDVE